MIIRRTLLIIGLLVLLVLALASCAPAPSANGALATATLDPAVTPTDCGCSAEGPNKLKATPALGSGPAGPAAPGPETSPAPAETAGRWETYTSADGAFSFEYPAAYTAQPYNFCAARPNANPPAGTQSALSLGSRTEISVSPAPASLDAALEAFRKDPARKDFQFDAARDRTVGGVPARTLSYRSGGANRYAESAFFMKDGLLYRVDTGTPSACDMPDLNLTELDAYTHLLDSFQFP